MSDPKPTVKVATSVVDIERCFPVLSQLRPHLVAEDWVARVRAQQQQGYTLVGVYVGDACVSAAGYRLLNNLAWGKFLYVDDLVTVERARGQGHADRLMQWLVKEARSLGCEALHLDSGHSRFDAHRFYLKHGLQITSHHFALSL